MINDINKTILEDKTVCIRENDAENNGFDALVTIKYTSWNDRSVVKILSYFVEGKETDAIIIIKNVETDSSNHSQYPI